MIGQRARTTSENSRSRWRVMRADLERAAGFADVGQALDPVEIDDVVGLHEPEVEHRHQRLPARQQLGVLQTAEQRDGLVDRLRIVIAEGRWLHAMASSFMRCQLGDFFTYTNDYASIKKSANSQIWDKSAVTVRPPSGAHRRCGEDR